MNTMGATRSSAGPMIRQFLLDDSGQDLIEYALIAALIALSAVAGMGSVAKAVNEIFSSVGAKIEAYIV